MVKPADKSSTKLSLAEMLEQLTRELGYAHIAKRRILAKLEADEFGFSFQDADGNATTNRLPPGCTWDRAVFVWARSAIFFCDTPVATPLSPAERMRAWGARLNGLPYDHRLDQRQTGIQVYAVKVWPKAVAATGSKPAPAKSKAVKRRPRRLKAPVEPGAPVSEPEVLLRARDQTRMVGRLSHSRDEAQAGHLQEHYEGQRGHRNVDEEQLHNQGRRICAPRDREAPP